MSDKSFFMYLNFVDLTFRAQSFGLTISQLDILTNDILFCDRKNIKHFWYWYINLLGCDSLLLYSTATSALYISTKHKHFIILSDVVWPYLLWLFKTIDVSCQKLSHLVLFFFFFVSVTFHYISMWSPLPLALLSLVLLLSIFLIEKTEKNEWI